MRRTRGEPAGNTAVTVKEYLGVMYSKMSPVSGLMKRRICSARAQELTWVEVGLKSVKAQEIVDCSLFAR